MKAGSGLASGSSAHPELAAEAVQQALAAAGLERAASVCLFLTRDFIRHAQPAVLAAARAAGSLQVFGCTANGLFTENGWLLDQAGAAALVFANPASGDDADAPLISFSGQGGLHLDWQAGAPRAGLLESDAAVWSHARVAEDGRTTTRLTGLHSHLVVSSGLRLLSQPHVVTASRGLDLCQLAGQNAGDSLLRSLPAELREHPPLHQIVALRQRNEPGLGILALNADASLTLTEALQEGEKISWAIRQPMAAEQDMREVLGAAVDTGCKPDFALMFSCIGRGPLFYGNDDRDLLAFREQFPGTPLLGAYGSGQIAPTGNGNRLFQNSAITLLFAGTHAV